jgi:hypothetical protein
MIFNFNGDESAMNEMFKLMITIIVVIAIVSVVFFQFIYPHTEPYKADVRLNNTVKQYQRTHTDEKLTEITSTLSLELPKNIQKGFYLDDYYHVQTVTKANVWDVVTHNNDVYVFSK